MVEYLKKGGIVLMVLFALVGVNHVFASEKEMMSVNEVIVQTTESGLQYTILKEGNGSYPKATDTVTVHYLGTLLDGTEFDSSYKRGQPTSFPLNGVIPGWTEGLQLIQPGGKIKLIIPSNLAYGSRAMGSIPANSTLIFEVELLSIK